MRSPPSNVIDRTIAYRIGVPRIPQTAITAPRLLVSLGPVQQNKPCDAGLRHCVVKSGIYIESDEIAKREILRLEHPFDYASTERLLGGHYDKEWALYGFKVDACRLRLDYYNLKDPDLRGVIELGRRFSLLKFVIKIPRQFLTGSELSRIPKFHTDFCQYDIQLHRHPWKTQRSYIFWKHQYTECITHVECTHVDIQNDHRLVWQFELSGRDFIYPLS